MPTAEEYRLAAEASGLRRGDHVRVIRSAGDHEMGWPNSWPNEMNEAIGNDYKIREVSFTGQIKFDVPIDHPFRYKRFPFFVLELIRPVGG